ncbi:hypothetical protein IKJ53_03605 [bacterium]|nr:hypothetical protein [bacterium]
MGLATSQVRLLALTRRKADIELDIQINSKRKQALTRRATELSQQYYHKLQNSKIQYATSDGYENVNYNYLMGVTGPGGVYEGDFLQQIAVGNGNLPQKSSNTMILTDQYGKVVLNNELSEMVLTNQIAFGDKDKVEQVARTIYDFINQNSGQCQSFTTIDNFFGNLVYSGNETKIENEAVEILKKMVKNGGFMNGGVIYLVEGTEDDPEYVRSYELAKSGANRSASDYVTLQDGYNYTIRDFNNGPAANSGWMYDADKETFIDNSANDICNYIGNLVSYFAPMLSAAFSNGVSAELGTVHSQNYYSDVRIPQGAHDSPRAAAEKYFENANGLVTVQGNDGLLYVYTEHTGGYVNSLNEEDDTLDMRKWLTASLKDNFKFEEACDTDKLQAGFQSGVFQLCNVYNVQNGSYRRNTTLEYFVHMGYVSEKLDSSEREEINAWYNAEQAKISEQETYWDLEVTNLSTELSAVNTELEAVKTLKSDAIKSVFDWGSS